MGLVRAQLPPRDPVSSYCHGLRPWRLGLLHVNLGGYNSVRHIRYVNCISIKLFLKKKKKKSK